MYMRIAISLVVSLGMAACTGQRLGRAHQAETECQIFDGIPYGGGTYGSGCTGGSGSPDAGVGSGSDDAGPGGGDAGPGSDAGPGCGGSGSGCCGGSGSGCCDGSGSGCCAGSGGGCCNGSGSGCCTGPGCDDCVPATTVLPQLLEGLTAIDCATPIETLDAILFELWRLGYFVNCDGEGSGTTCDADRAVLAAALAQLQALPIASDCPAEQQAEIDEIVGATGPLTSCGDTTIDNSEPPPPPSGCAAIDWDRLSPAPLIGGSCQAIALTTSAGSWDSVGDADPSIVIPGATTTSFSTWERSLDDFGNSLHPASELLSRFGLSTSQIGFLRAATDLDQLYAAVDLRPLQPQLIAADHIVVIYGRNNAAAAYIDEGEPPLGLDPGAYGKYLWIQDYEHSPRRDSIKILSCNAQQLIGNRAFGLSSRVAIETPWVPYVRERPGVWAAVLACASTPPAARPPAHRNTSDREMSQ